MRPAILGLVVLICGCGKVGEPLPPFVRIPEQIGGLTAFQDGLEVVLQWTNPARYVDGSPAVELDVVELRSDQGIVARFPASGPGQPQTHAIPVDSWIGTTRTFTVRAGARGRFSEPASISASPVAVPGPVGNLQAVMDQHVITLSWDPPADNPELADAYIVRRNDWEQSVVTRTNTTNYVDLAVVAGTQYTYTVRSARQLDGGPIPGVGSATGAITAEDRTPPAVPSGLQAVISDAGAFLAWDANRERDIAGYRVFRRLRDDGAWELLTDELHTANSYIDAGHAPGAVYAVSAVDEDGNESARSDPIRP